MQEKGLAAAYMDHDSVHKYCRRLMSLPFLPAADIPAAFNAIKEKAKNQSLVDITDYIERTWIDSSMWPPRVWTAYRRHVRTNNDCESWHARLNRRAVSANLPLYKLILLLHRETVIVNIGLKVLSEEKIQRHPKRSTAVLEARLDTLWTEYEAGTRSADKLLRACSRIYACNA